MAILGAFHHATQIAPPFIRERVYNGEIDRYAVLKGCTSGELYKMVAEFIVGIT